MRPASWTLPPGDSDFSTRWRLIKAVSPERCQSKALPKHERLSAARKARGEHGIWPRRFWEHMIRDEAMTRDMSNIAISIRSSTDWSRACAIGLTPRFIAMYARDYFRPIGAAKSKRSVSFGERR
jgi:hypothetical protein